MRSQVGAGVFTLRPCTQSVRSPLTKSAEHGPELGVQADWARSFLDFLPVTTPNSHNDLLPHFNHDIPTARVLHRVQDMSTVMPVDLGRASPAMGGSTVSDLCA